jgi:hypothetical protein
VQSGHAGSRRASACGEDIADSDVLDVLGVEIYRLVGVTEDVEKDFFGVCVLEATLLALEVNVSGRRVNILGVEYLCLSRADGGDNNDVVVVLCEDSSFGHGGG